MKKTGLIILIIASAFINICKVTGQVAQSKTFIEYLYDANGNRTYRHVVVVSGNNLKTTKPDSSELFVKELFLEKLGSIEVSVFPNPTNGIINLKLDDKSLAALSDAIIEIYNESGVKLFYEKWNNLNQVVDLTNFSGGVYYLKLWINGENKTIKIIKIN